jgi:hypothetical protein
VATLPGGAKINNITDLQWLTPSNSAIEGKSVLGELANRPPPWDDPPEIGNPAGLPKRHGASKDDRLGGAIENTNTPASQNIQARICQRCCQPFEPRKGNGGGKQKYCSSACRKAFNANPSVAPSVLPASNDAPKAQSTTLAPPTLEPEDDQREFRWNDEDTIIRSQPAIAVYFNPHGEIVIRQDHWIYVNRQNLPRLIRRLQEIEAGVA